MRQAAAIHAKLLTRSELERPRAWLSWFGLSGSDNELLFVLPRGGARGVPKAPIDAWLPMLLMPMPEPRLDPAAAKFMFEQNEMFDLRRELCRSKVFCAENGDGLTRYLKYIIKLLIIILFYHRG